MLEGLVPPNSANTLLLLGTSTSGLWARLRTYSLVGIPYFVVDCPTFFFCLFRMQQNHSITDRIESATTPPTTPAIIGAAGLFEDERPTGVREEVAETVTVAMTLTESSVESGVEVDVLDVLDDRKFSDAELSWLGDAPASGQAGKLQGSTEQQPANSIVEVLHVYHCVLLPDGQLCSSLSTVSRSRRCILGVDQGNAEHNFDYERVNLDKGV